MKRLLSGMIAAPILAMGFISAADAQEYDPSYFNLFALWGLTASPDQPRDFESVVFLIIDGAAEIEDPIMLNDLNLTFESADDDIDALPL